MSDQSESCGEIRIDRETAEIMADSLRECIGAEVICAANEQEATGHHQTGISTVTLARVEAAALLLEEHSVEEAHRISDEMWNPYKQVTEDASEQEWEPGGGGVGRYVPSYEEYVPQKVRERNQAIGLKSKRRLFLNQSLQGLASMYRLSVEELVATFHSSPNDSARQKLLDSIAGTEEELAEKIAQAEETGGEDGPQG